VSDPVKTGGFVLAAVLSVVLVLVTGPSSERGATFEDEGTVFFPELTAPDQAASLEVIEVDLGTVTERRFQVKRDDAGRWRIPSHHDYPADAKDRMAEAASLLIGLRRGRAVTETRADHARLGVCDPTDGTAPVEGRGTKVTFRDGAGNVLAALILGKRVEDRSGLRYAREPERMRSYTIELDAEISARFADWIETDLLELQESEIERLTFHGYSVDEQEGRLVDLDKKVIAKKDGYEWTVIGAAAGEEANASTLDRATSTLDDLRIVGVQR